jgi:hypothetical protein
MCTPAGSRLAGLELETAEVWSRRVRGPPSRVAEVVARLGLGAPADLRGGPTGFGLACAWSRCRGLRTRVDAACRRSRQDRPPRRGAAVAALARRRAVAGAGALAGRGVVSRPRPRSRGRTRRSDGHRHGLSKLLPRRELRPPAGTPGAWSVPWMNWVRRPRLEDPRGAGHPRRLPGGGRGRAPAPLDARPRARRGLATEPIPDDDRQAALLRGIDTLSASGVAAEVGDFDRFAPRPVDGLPRDRPERALLRRHTPPGRDHLGRFKPRPALAGRGRPRLPPPAAGQLRARPPPARPGPARGQRRLARPGAPSPPLVPPRGRHPNPAAVPWPRSWFSTQREHWRGSRLYAVRACRSSQARVCVLAVETLRIHAKGAA